MRQHEGRLTLALLQSQMEEGSNKTVVDLDLHQQSLKSLASSWKESKSIESKEVDEQTMTLKRENEFLCCCVVTTMTTVRMDCN